MAVDGALSHAVDAAQRTAVSAYALDTEGFLPQALTFASSQGLPVRGAVAVQLSGHVSPTGVMEPLGDRRIGASR